MLGLPAQIEFRIAGVKSRIDDIDNIPGGDFEGSDNPVQPHQKPGCRRNILSGRTRARGDVRKKTTPVPAIDLINEDAEGYNVVVRNFPAGVSNIYRN